MISSHLLATLIVACALWVRALQVHAFQFTSDCVCGIKANRFRRLATGGRDVIDGDQPWFAGLVKRSHSDQDYSNPFCGATLISSQYLLTAAHCVYNKRAQDLGVLIDLYDLNEFDAQQHILNISQMIVHEKYQDHEKRPEIDIALIRLIKPVSITDRVRPICLPDLPKSLWTNDHHDSIASSNVSTRSRYAREVNMLPFLAETNSSVKVDTLKSKYQTSNESKPAHDPHIKYVGLLTAVGWGRLSRTGPLADHLQQVSMPQDVDSCNLVYGPDFHRDHICLKDPRRVKHGWKDVCKGDSGGPLIHRWNRTDWLVGVTSYGNCLGIPAAVFTRVTSYLPWIDQHTRTSLFCDRPVPSP